MAGKKTKKKKPTSAICINHLIIADITRGMTQACDFRVGSVATRPCDWMDGWVGSLLKNVFSFASRADLLGQVPRALVRWLSSQKTVPCKKIVIGEKLISAGDRS